MENRSDSIAAIAAALAKAQGMIKGAIKDSENPFFKSTYADLASVWDACREPLSINGLAIVQIPHESIDQVIIETILMHASGEWISGKISMKPIKTDPQSIGSCLTYARRYALSSIVGIAPLDDDDANAATGKKINGTSKPLDTTHQNKDKRQDAPGQEILSESISEPQRKRFWAIAKATKASDEQIKEWLYREYDIEHTKDIPRTLYEEICEKIRSDLTEKGE